MRPQCAAQQRARPGSRASCMHEFRFYYFTPLYDETVAFYRDVLGFELYRSWDRPDGDRGTIFRAPGGSGLTEIEAGSTVPTVQGGFYIEVDDVEAWRARVGDAGAPIVRELTLMSYGHRSFKTRDPSGIEVVVLRTCRGRMTVTRSFRRQQLARLFRPFRRGHALPFMRVRWQWCAVCAFLAGACGSDRGQAVPTFDALFPEERLVSLEEDVDDPLTQITSFTPRADGSFVIVDGPAARARQYDAEGRLERVWGRPGEGPGELRMPSAAAYGPSGELHVVERGSPRRTVFWAEDSVSVHRLPANYGYWLHAAGEGLVVGLGTPDERFGLLSYDGHLTARFARRDPQIAEMPFWVFFVRERAAVAGDRVFVNSSFDPTIRVYSTSGDSLFAFGTAPPTWVEPTRPDIAAISGPADRARIEAWARSFTVVTGLAAVDGVLVVQYGRHDPGPNASDRVVRRTADVYAVDGEKLVEGISFDRRILAGGARLYVLESEPPDAWTISVRRYAAHR